MAEVIGPCSSLPGAHHPVPMGTTCDTHPGRPASHRVQGETDSFGAELNDMCQQCYEKHKVAMEKYREEHACGTCEWCGNSANDLRNRRDFEEGTCGRIYQVCGACVRKENEEAEEELRARGYYDDRDLELELDSRADDSWHDEEESDYLFGEPLCLDVPEEPKSVPPGSFPKAYVDGEFIY